MFKYFLVFLLTLSILITCTSCFSKEENNEGPGNVVNLPPKIYEYGIFEAYANGSKYMKATSFSVSTSYGHNDLSYDGENYYVILGVETNLTEDDFADEKNKVVLSDAIGTGRLNFVTMDSENEKLIYEIPMDQSYDYPTLTELKLSGLRGNTGTGYFSIEVYALSGPDSLYPYRNITLGLNRG